MIYVTMYLLAIVAANLSVSAFGPDVSVLNAFLFIGLDLTARDRLHDAWKGKNLLLKMTALIACGSALSYILNVDAGQIAIASFIAFAAAGLSDTVMYTLLGDRIRFIRVNGSNVVSAGVDSLLFPAIAFGFPLLIPIMIGQLLAKVTGGFVWSIVLLLVEAVRQDGVTNE